MVQDKKRERSLTNYSHRQNRLHLEVNLLPIKSHSMIMRNKTQILKQLLPPPFLFFLDSASLSILLPLSPKWHMGMGNGSWQLIIHSFVLTLFPCSSVDSLRQDGIGAQLLHHGLHHWLQRNLSSSTQSTSCLSSADLGVCRAVAFTPFLRSC